MSTPRWSMSLGAAPGDATAALPVDRPPEVADVRRLGRMVTRRLVRLARADEQPSVAQLVGDFLERPTEGLDVVEEGWPTYDHVNVQAGLDAWLAAEGRRHQLVGLVGTRHSDFTFADLLGSGPEDPFGPRPGSVSRVNRSTGPGEEVLACVRDGLYLVTWGEHRLAMLLREAMSEVDQNSVTLQAVGTDVTVAAMAAQQIREATLEHNVHRGQVLSFGTDVYGERVGLLSLHRRPSMSAEQLILPADVFADIERQVVGVARHREALRRAGQHLKRGLLLYGPPGVGKTHTVRYLAATLRDTTILELSGQALHLIGEACSLARTLQPAVIVVEDVDLIAEERDHYGGETPLLFTLLNEMDGLDEDADVVFLLTTNRPDLLEPALAARPGRVDQAVEIPLPDRESRERLFRLYQGSLAVDDSGLDGVLDRTDGVTASFLKELLRRAAVLAATRAEADLNVSAADLDAALHDLLDTRNAMTRRVLGVTAQTE